MKEKYSGFEVNYDKEASVFFIETEERGRIERETLKEMHTCIDNLGKEKVAKQPAQKAIRADVDDTELRLVKVGAFGMFRNSWSRGERGLYAWITRVSSTGRDAGRERVDMSRSWGATYYQDTPETRAIIVERQKLLANAEAVVEKIKKETEKMYSKLPQVKPTVAEADLPIWGS